MTGIYMYENKINGNKYIGQSVNITRRQKEHRNRFKDKGSSEYESSLHRAFRKYGYENFEFKILELCLAEDLNKKEIYWIKFYNTFSSGYNQNLGGNYTSVPQKMTKELLNTITEDLLKTNKTLTEISKKRGVSLTLVHYINTGDSWFRSNIDYPIRKIVRNKKKYFCKDCGIEITRFGERCVSCSAMAQRRTERPEPIKLAKMVVEKGYEGTGKEFGVTGSAVRKWCKSYGIGDKKSEVAMWYAINKKMEL